MVTVALAGAISMAVAMGFGRFSYTPILPGMMAGLGLSAADAGVIASANFVGYLVGAVLGAYGWAAGHERKLGIGSLAATALLLLCMGLSGSLWAFVIIRFLAGVASAFVMIFISGIVLGRGAAAGNENVVSVHFGGVGLGIALSSLMVFGLAFLESPVETAWRVDWFGGAAIALAGLVAVVFLLPKTPRSAMRPAGEPKLVWSRPLVAITFTYGLFGFGYVITATFLVAMARQGQADHTLEFLAWFFTGITAALSIHSWKRMLPAVGITGAYVIGLLVEAVGVASTVWLPNPFAPVLGGLMLGATFMMVTAYGLQIGRRLAPSSPRRALAFMTAAFGVGQIAGPIIAGWLAQKTGSFAAPSLIASAVLVFCAVVTLAEIRRINAAIK